MRSARTKSVVRYFIVFYFTDYAGSPLSGSGFFRQP
jgi:hypothetical protein